MSDAYTSAAFSDKNVGTGKLVSVTGISLSGIDSGNYNLTSMTASTTADITARAITVSAHGIDKPYDGNTAAAIAIVRQDTGRKYFDDLRSVLSQLSEDATAEVQDRREESIAQRRWLMGATTAGLIISAALSVIALSRHSSNRDDSSIHTL